MAFSYKVLIAHEVIKYYGSKAKLDLESILPSFKLLFDSPSKTVSFGCSLNPRNVLVQNSLLPLEKFESELIQDVQASDEEIKFFVNTEKFLQHSLNSDLSCGTSKSLMKTCKTVVDFSSPNIAKPFHFGHLRSTIIGNFISNISKFMRNDVITINYLGDWGVQFGLLKYGLDECKINVDELTENPLKTLYHAYVTANSIAEKKPKVYEQAKEIFRKMEMAEQENDDLKKWVSIKNYTTHEISKIYDRLGIQFDIYSWESDYSAKRIEDLIKTLIEKNIIVKENDALVAKMSCDNSVPVLKSDGTTLYLTRDLAAVLDRYQRYSFDRMLYVVDNSQSKHFRHLIQLVEKVNVECARKIEHIMFGRVIGISTRKGSAIFLDDILNEIQSRMEESRMNTLTTRGENGEKITDVLGISAVVVNDLKRRRNSNYKFNWNSVLQSKYDSGIKLQYCHCRLYSLEENAGIKIPEKCEVDLLKEPEALNLIVEISKFEDAVINSYKHLESCILLEYLFNLCDAINRAHKVLRVKGENESVASQRLLMFHKARLTLNVGMKIVGITPLNQM